MDGGLIIKYMNRLIDYFDRIVIINLPERIDRKKAILEEIKKIGGSLSNKIRIFSAIRPKEAGGFPSIGAHGCFESHLSVLKEAMEDRVDKLLILEDDLLFDKSLYEKEEAVVLALQELPWSMVYLVHQVPESELTPMLLQPYNKPLVTIPCVGFTEPLLKQLVPYLDAVKGREAGDPKGGKMHVDGAYNHFRKDHPELATYVSNPSLGRERSSRSDIADNCWFDRIYGLRRVIGWLRTWKESLKR
jgi:glycosyl transferase, family 25